MTSDSRLRSSLIFPMLVAPAAAMEGGAAAFMLVCKQDSRPGSEAEGWAAAAAALAARSERLVDLRAAGSSCRLPLVAPTLSVSAEVTLAPEEYARDVADFLADPLAPLRLAGSDPLLETAPTPGGAMAAGSTLAISDAPDAPPDWTREDPRAPFRKAGSAPRLAIAPTPTPTGGATGSMFLLDEVAATAVGVIADEPRAPFRAAGSTPLLATAPTPVGLEATGAGASAGAERGAGSGADVGAAAQPPAIIC